MNELLGEAAGTRPLEDVIVEAQERDDRKLFDNEIAERHGSVGAAPGGTSTVRVV